MQPFAPPENVSYAHPVAAFFHVCFKIAAVLVYILFPKSQFIIHFVICLVLLTLDFWVTKNITGRLLVGLRWWNDVGDPETGEGSNWRFEALAEGQRTVNAKDTWVFWTALYVAPLAWIVLGLFAIIGLKFDYALIVTLGAVLTGANLFGYIKCSKEASKQLHDFATNAITSGLTAAVRSRVG